MSKPDRSPIPVTHPVVDLSRVSPAARALATVMHVRDNCLCLHVQRAARALARRYDEAFRPLKLTNGQFSLMMALNQPSTPNLTRMSRFLAMDRTTMTAHLKVLERRGWVRVKADPRDRRNHRLTLTPAGRALLAEALPLWEAAQRETLAEISRNEADDLKALLGHLS